MAAITLKAIPTPLHKALKHQAAQHKRSLNKEVIALLEEAMAPSRQINVEELLAQTRQIRDSLSASITPEEVERWKREGRP